MNLVRSKLIINDPPLRSSGGSGSTASIQQSEAFADPGKTRLYTLNDGKTPDDILLAIVNEQVMFGSITADWQQVNTTTIRFGFDIDGKNIQVLFK